MRTNKLFLVPILVGLVLSGEAMAQNATTGAIQGVVTDQATGQPLPGVTVVITSTALQGTQSAITGERGDYKITNLPPGTYVVTFYYSDITIERTNNQVGINKTTPVYQKVDTTKIGGEKIIIQGSAPSVDPTSTTQGTTMSQDYIKNIPVPGRTFEDTLGAAAGSAGDELGVSFSGSTSLENSYIVDGVNTTGLTFGTVGSAVINNFIEEIEVITGGYNAEFGRATGGVVNVVTKSGSNEFEGEVFATLTPGFLVAQGDRVPSQSSTIDAESNLAFATDFGFTLGGPIIKDKVWFFVGFAPQIGRVNVTRITKRRMDCHAVIDGQLGEVCNPDPIAEGGNADGIADEDPETGFLVFEELTRQNVVQDAASFQFVSKVNFALTPEHQGQVSLIGTPGSGQTAGVLGQPSATRRDFTQLTTDLSGKWTSKLNDNKTEVEAVVGWHRSSLEVDSIDNAANALPRTDYLFGNLGAMLRAFEADNPFAQRTIGFCDDAAANDAFPLIENCPTIQYSAGGPGGIADDLEQRFSGRLAGTHRIKAAGNHEIKAGIDLENNLRTAPRVLSGGVLHAALLDRDQVESTRLVRLGLEGDPLFDQMCQDGLDAVFPCQFQEEVGVTGQTLNWGAYLRDSWQILPNLTLNAGIRYEEQRLRFAEELQGTTDALTGRELGKNAMVLQNMWAPRVGVLYDWTKEGRSKVYAHWGRFYESIPMDINDRSFGGETSYRETRSTAQCQDIPGVGGLPDANQCMGDASSSVLFGSGVLIAPGIKSQYLDEIVLGAEYELLEDLKVGVSYHNRQMGRVIEDVSTDGADTYILANPGEFPAEEEARLQAQIDALPMGEERAQLEAELEQFKGIRIFDKPRRDYHALQFTAVKRLSRNFFVQGSYTYSRTLGNYPGLFSADNGQVDPNITSQYDLIELLSNRDGPLPQDRPHYFKLDGFYRFDFKREGVLTTGTRFRALSGTPVNALGRHFLYGFDEAFLLPRGEIGRTDDEVSIDLHVGYARQLSKGMSLEVYFDLFNVLNNQGEFNRDATYTFDSVNPIVGGTYEDLIWAKRDPRDVGDPNALGQPITRNINFRNTAARYSPFSGRFGARLTF